MRGKFGHLPWLLLALGLAHCGVPTSEPVKQEVLGAEAKSAEACTPPLRLREFAAGEGASEPTDVDGTLFFSTPGALWKSDATVTGTVKLRDFPPDEFGNLSFPRKLIEARGLLFFEYGRTLWRSDGTAAGTFPLVTSAFTTPLREYRGRLLFIREAPGKGRELWSSDGTPAGTRLFIDVNPGPPSSNIGESVVTASGDLVFGAVLGEDEQDVALLKLTPRGRLEELFRSRAPVTSIFRLTAVGDRLFFIIDIGDLGETYLYTSDGTPGGASPVKYLGPINTPLGAFAAYKNRLFFVARPDDASDLTHLELWVSDGAPERTFLFADLRPGPEGSTPAELTVFEDLLYFSADDGRHGRELWATDGTEGGTRLAVDIRPGAVGSDPHELRSANRKLYFVADEGTHGTEPWKVYQGRARIVADVVPGPEGAALLNLAYGQDSDDVFFRSGGYVFFSTREDSPAQGSALWSMKTGTYCPVP